MTDTYQETNNLMQQKNTSLEGALWQVGRLVIEDNIIESSLNRFMDAIPDARAGTFAINLYAGASQAAGYPYVFLNAIIRRNVLQHVDNVVSNTPPYYHFGIYLNGCLSAIVEDTS